MMQPSTKQPLVWVAVVSLLGSASWGVAAQDVRAQGAERSDLRATLLDEDLVSRPVRLLSLDEKRLEFVDEHDRRRTLPRSRILALLPVTAPVVAPVAWSSVPLPLPGELRLVDGQRFPGDLVGGAADAERVLWALPGLERVEFQIERVSAFVRPRPANSPELVRGPVDQDVLLLTNGDRLSGFLARMNGVARLEPDDGDPIEVELGRIVGAVLANRARPASGVRVWLDDGTVANVSRLELGAGGRLGLAIEAGVSGSFEFSSLRAVVFDGSRLAALATLAPERWSPTGERRWAPPVRELRPPAARGALAVVPLDAPDLLLPGPMSVSYALPSGVRRIAAVVRLDDASPPWGDCEFIVRLDGREVVRKRLSGEGEPFLMNIELSGRELTLVVEEGRFGPVKDWVVLERPLLLLSPSEDR